MITELPQFVLSIRLFPANLCYNNLLYWLNEWFDLSNKTRYRRTLFRDVTRRCGLRWLRHVGCLLYRLGKCMFQVGGGWNCLRQNSVSGESVSPQN